MSQKLTFTTSSLLNTTVSDATDVVYYDIQTPAWDPQRTTVRRLDPRTGMYARTGTVQNEADDPVAVSVYDGAPGPVPQWVQKVDGTTPGESRWQFDDGEKRAFAWRVANGRLELYSADEGVKIKRKLATFHPHKRLLLVGLMSQHAYLDVDTSVMGSVDAIILSLLIVERRRRAGMSA